MGKLYQGVRVDGDAHVYVITDSGRAPLPPCNEIRDHSPDGFEWGYGGSGPAQLALALCVDALGGNDVNDGVCTARYDEDEGCLALVDQDGRVPVTCKCKVTGKHRVHQCIQPECNQRWYSPEVERALGVYQDFKFRHIAGLDGPTEKEDQWSMTADQVRHYIAEIEKPTVPLAELRA
jgi:hypothetical protein